MLYSNRSAGGAPVFPSSYSLKCHLPFLSDFYCPPHSSLGIIWHSFILLISLLFDSISSEREYFQYFFFSPPLLLFMPLGVVFFLFQLHSVWYYHLQWVAAVVLSGFVRCWLKSLFWMEGGQAKCKCSIHIVMGGMTDGLRTFHLTHHSEEN